MTKEAHRDGLGCTLALHRLKRQPGVLKLTFGTRNLWSKSSLLLYYAPRPSIKRSWGGVPLIGFLSRVYFDRRHTILVRTIQTVVRSTTFQRNLPPLIFPRVLLVFVLLCVAAWLALMSIVFMRYACCLV